MLSYSADFVPLPCVTSPAHSAQPGAVSSSPILIRPSLNFPKQGAQFLDQNVPCAPRMQQVLLPSSNQPLSSGSCANPGIFPLDVLSVISLPHQTELWDIELVTPIHLHTPNAHIGTLAGAFPGQTIQALDLLSFLHDFAKKPIDYRRTFASLPHRTQLVVHRAFQTRGIQALNHQVGTSWRQFVSAQNVQEVGPLGIDLLSGNREVWGFEIHYNGYSIIHLDGALMDA